MISVDFSLKGKPDRRPDAVSLVVSVPAFWFYDVFFFGLTAERL